MSSLDEVYEEIRDDPFWSYLRTPGIKLVPGFGAEHPKVLLVGEAPGAVENARGRPFCGPSGRVLHQLMELAGLRLEDLKGIGRLIPGGGEGEIHPANAFVTNVVKYRPPNNATPNLAAILHAVEGRTGEREDGTAFSARKPDGRGSLRREWAALGRPRLIVCVGGVAHTAMHPQGGYMSVSNWAGQPPQERNGIWFSSQYHPAFGMRRKNMQLKMERHWEVLGKWIQERDIL